MCSTSRPAARDGEADRHRLLAAADPDHGHPAGGRVQGPEGLCRDLTYLRVTGRKPPGEEVVRKASGPDSEEAAEAALGGAIDLLRLYEDPERGYPSKVAPQWVKEYPGDYDHLARVFEWSTGGDGEGGDE